MPDLLAGLLPRPSTPVPGTWLLPCPDVLNVYVFGVNSTSAAATTAAAAVAPERSPLSLAIPGAARTPTPPEPPAVDTAVPAAPEATSASSPPSPAASLLDALRADPLERAWSALNSSEGEVRGLFGGMAAVVKPAANGGARELWVFAQGEVGVPEGCVEISRPAPISLAATLTCAAHGHSLGCLSNPACEPRFAPSASWHILEAAAGEKLAWAMGIRIALLPGDIALGPEPFAVRLRPTSPSSTPAPAVGAAFAGALILTAKPRPPPLCKPFPPATAGAGPMVLRPLSLPALFIAPQSVNTAQDARLCAAFDATLGVSWKAGRVEARVASQARGPGASDWSVYFVPLSAGQSFSTALPGAVAAKWRGAHGVLTIWPTHLARPLAPPRRPAVASAPKPGPGLGAPSDLLGTAAGLFDFFASYSEPEPEGEDDEETEETEEPVVVEDDTSSKREDESVDDLFSAHSSPGEPAPEVVEADLFGSTFTTPRPSALELDTGTGAEITMGDITMEDVDDLFGDDDEPAQEQPEEPEAPEPPPLLAPPDEPADTVMPPSRASLVTQDERNLITEDDFNFFDSDSPKPDDVELEVATPETPKGERVFEPTGAEPAFEVISHPVSPTRSHPLSTLLHMSSQFRMEALGNRLARHQSDMEETERKDALDGEIDGEAEDELQEAAAEEPREEEEVEEEAEPPAKKPRFANLVPPAFAPLQLSARHKPRFPYGLPSPAATVSGLNADLIERLRQSQKKRKSGDKDKYESTYDYSAGWDVDSDSDDTEDDSALTTGAPPTPSSTADDDDRGSVPPSATFPPPPPPAMTDDEVEFDGGVCVAGEWAILKDDPAAAAPFARAWVSSWVEAKDHRDAYPSPTSPSAAIDTVGTRLGDIDVDVLANAVVQNRFFRDIFDATMQPEPERPTSLLKSGMPLSELTDDDADGLGGHSKNYTLPSANVNVGFGGTVMRISAAGLRYWRELGLAPAGGRKNLTAYAVCEPGDESARAAATFLKDIGEVYDAHHLGTHEPGGQSEEDEEEPEEGEEKPASPKKDKAKEFDYAAAVVAAPISAMAAQIARLRRNATTPTVVYVITHNSSVSPAALAPLLSAPSYLSIAHVVPASAVRVQNLVPVAFEVYDLFPRRIAHVNLHGKPLDIPTKYLPYPAFTVAGDDPKPQLSMAWPQRNYDVLVRWRSIHGAWAWLPDVAILVLAVTDSQGDAATVKAVKMETGSSPAARAQKAWDVFTAFAKESATEWRLSICAATLMTMEEIDAWKTLLAAQTEPATLLMLDPAAAPDAPRPRPPVANIPPSTFADPGASIVDETLTVGCAALSRRVAVDLPSSSGCADDAACGLAAGVTIYPSSSFVFSFANNTGTGASSCVFHILQHRPPPGADEVAAKFVSEEFHRLAALGRRRYGLNGVGVMHVESVAAVRRAVEAIAAA